MKGRENPFVNRSRITTWSPDQCLFCGSQSFTEPPPFHDTFDVLDYRGHLSAIFICDGCKKEWLVRYIDPGMIPILRELFDQAEDVREFEDLYMKYIEPHRKEPLMLLLN